MIYVLVLINIIFLMGVLYFMVESKRKDRVQENQNISKLYEAIAKMQVEYFKSLRECSRKSDLLLDKNNREFLKVFAQVFRKDIPSEPAKTEKEEVIENSIENASEPEEVSLADSPRIPIVEGVNIRFEDEEQVYPMNIDPIENYKENKGENPIEK
jgi:hypothetical protein